MKLNTTIKKNYLHLFILPITLMLTLISCSKTESPATAPTSTSEAAKSVASVGPSAPNNNLLYYGSISPDLSIGCLGDFYLDINKGMLYGPKTTYGWSSALSMQGASAAENKIYSGNNIPTTTLGSTGDYYLNTSNFVLYGPRVVSGWGKAINLLHPR